MIVPTDRTQFFSDCVIGIAITIMVVEKGLSIGNEVALNGIWVSLRKMTPSLLVYMLSFFTLGILWVGHHSFYLVTSKIKITSFWYNLHVLFWITLIPFSTEMIGNNLLFPAAIAFYGLVMFMISFAFALSRRHILKNKLLINSGNHYLNGRLKYLARIKQIKTKIALALYFISIPSAFLFIPLAYICLVVPVVLYLIPDEIKSKKLAKNLYETMNGNNK